jgi:CelD/BcsL family acetyltransferase involved in cellulose biosynthesis
MATHDVDPPRRQPVTSTPPARTDSRRLAQPLVIEDLDSLAPHIEAWDALAIEQGKPFCAPGWMLSWWREARTGDARLRVVLVLDEHGLAAVGPFFAQVSFGLVELRLLAAGFSHRIGVLARQEGQDRVAAALSQALAEVRPRAASVVFEGVDGDDPWPDLIAAHWPSRKQPHGRIDTTMDAPVIDLNGSYEEWMERRERRFRKEARRTARRMEGDGVRGEVVTGRTAIDALLRLHHARWEERGGSNVGDAAHAVIARAAEELRSDDRLCVALLETPSGPMAAELVVRAGDTAVFWGGGFDPQWTRLAPGTQAMLLALRVLAERGVRTVDLGGGAHDYKQRLADRDTTLVWRTIFPRGVRYPLIRLRLAPKHVRIALRELARRLPPRWRTRIKRIRQAPEERSR